MEEKKPEEKLEVHEGAEELLIEWGYALNELAFSSREGFNNFREIEKTAATHWLKRVVGELPKTKTAHEAALKFREIADSKKVILKKNFELEEKKGIIVGTFLSHDCPYKECCVARKKARQKYVCFRSTPFVTAIKLMADKEYKAEVLYDQTQPGNVCVLHGTPTQASFTVGLSYKLAKGTVKINELDCDKIKLGLIDKVAVSPTRKEIAGHKLIAMSYSQKKYPPGMIIMNMADAKSLGLMEKDTVFVRKATEKEEPVLFKEEEYEVEEDRYEIPGLEVPEEEEIKEEKEKPKELLEKVPSKEEEKKEEIKEQKEKPREKPKEKKEEPKKEIPNPKKEKFKKEEKIAEGKNIVVSPGKRKKQMKDFENKIDALRRKQK